MRDRFRPVKAAAIFWGAGLGWILFSDLVLTHWVPASAVHTTQLLLGLVSVSLVSILVGLLMVWSCAASRQGKAWYRELFDLVPEAVFVIDEHDRFVAANRVASDRYGYCHAELLTLGPADIVAPDHRAETPARLAAQRHGRHRVQSRHRRRDGQVIDVEMHSLPVHFGGQVFVLSHAQDITERRQSAEALQRSEESLRAVLGAAPVALFAMDLDGTVQFWNAYCETAFGWTAEEAVGHPLPLSEGPYGDECATLLDGVRAGHFFHGRELRRRRKDGELIDLRLSVAPLTDGEGQVVGVMSAMEDITAQKAIEQRLRHRERLLSQMERLANIGGWEFDPVSLEGNWTDQVARIHDLEPTDVVSVADALEVYLPESRARIDAAIAEAVASGQGYNLELEMITPRGRRKWVQTLGEATVENGQVVQLSGSFQDITERKLAEARVEHLNRVLLAIRDVNQLIARERDRGALLRQASELLVQHRSYRAAAIVLLDPAGHPSQWSHAGLQTPFGPLLESLPETAPPLFGEVLEAGQPLLRPLNDSATEAADIPILWLPLADDEVSYGVLGVVLEHPDRHDDEELSLLTELAGDIAYALRVLADNEARLAAEEARDRLEHQLAQTSRMEAIGQLAGGVAHDFNNILQAVLGYAEILATSTALTPADRHALSEIRKGGERAAALTRQLLAFSRRQVMQPRPLDLNALVADLLNMVRRLIGEHIDLVWNPSSPAALIFADAGMLEQAIVNLCINARDAMPEGGRLSLGTAPVALDADYVAAHPWARAGQYLLLTVSDNGTGMDRDTLEHIFEPFFTTKSDGRGTGLGLATVYGVVKQHHGMIHAYSEPGSGTTFRIYLPLTDQPAADAPAPASLAAAGGSETILLAEDDDLVRRLATAILERAGYRVLAAGDGAAAVALFEDHADEIAAALLDVVMPRLNGSEVYHQLRARRPDLPVLFSSGYNEASIHTNFVLHEGLALLPKPYAPAALLTQLRAVLDQAGKPAEE